MHRRLVDSMGSTVLVMLFMTANIMVTGFLVDNLGLVVNWSAVATTSTMV